MRNCLRVLKSEFRQKSTQGVVRNGAFPDGQRIRRRCGGFRCRAAVATEPNPVPVTLDSRTTALLVLDVAESPCNAQPKCEALVPRIRSLLAAARKMGALVIHSSADPSGITAPITQPPFLGQVAPAGGEP
jgi:hypothetical protein